MELKKRLVSIVTPLYNGEHYVSETIESVLSQTYKDWELIVVDDCSKDNGCQIVESYIAKDARIKLLKNESNSGPAKTRNTAIAAARGQYIAFLDSDDLWTENKLSDQIDFMNRNEAFFSFSYYEQITEDGNFIKTIDNLPDKVDYLSTIKSNKIGCLTA